MASAVIINDTRVDGHQGCNRVMRAIQDLCATSGIAVLGTARAHRDWRSDQGFLALFAKADLVIVNGEGTLHHDRAAAVPLLAAGPRARALGKRSALINFSWFANGPAFDAPLAEFDLVAARESRSRDAVRTVRDDCMLVPDLSFYGSKPGPQARREVGFGDSVNAAETMALRALQQRSGGRFVPIATAGDGPAGRLRLARQMLMRKEGHDPRPFSFRFRQAVDHVRLDVRDPDAYLLALARLRLLVTGRFHGATLALSAGTPVLAFPSNTPKIEAMLADAGLGGWRMTDAQAVGPALLERAAGWEDGERAALRQYVTGAERSAERLFSDIRALLA